MKEDIQEMNEFLKGLSQPTNTEDIIMTVSKKYKKTLSFSSVGFR